MITDYELAELARHIEGINIANGWKQPGEQREPLMVHMLVVTEVAELSEACRKDPYAPSEHIPEFSAEEEEVADIFIRMLDYAAERNISHRLFSAIEAKLRFNETRGFKHGGKRV